MSIVLRQSSSLNSFPQPTYKINRGPHMKETILTFLTY